MATADKSGKPHVIPICYAYDGIRFFSAIDQKPKRLPATKLKRIRNITDNPQVSLVIDHYEDDWNKLAYLMVQGNADILLEGKDYHDALVLLTDKYPQYQQANLADLHLPVIRITPAILSSWGVM